MVVFASVFGQPGCFAGSEEETSLAGLEEAFDVKVPKALEEGKIPGAVLLVGIRSGDGFRTWQKAYGLMQAEPCERPMAVDAVFDAASLTKPIATGTSLMILADRGRLSVDDPVAKYIPAFDTDEKRDVRVKDLMTHCSGQAPYVGKGERDKIEAEHGWPCPDAIRDYIVSLKLRHGPPRSNVVYSCLNAIVGALVVEKVSGESLDSFAAKNIFEPLGLRDTGFKPPVDLHDRIVPTTRSEHSSGEFLRGQVHDPLAAMQGGVSGNAGLFSSSQDIGRILQMMLNGGELDGVRILRPETVRAMTTVGTPPGLKNLKGNPDRRGLLWDIYQPDPGDTGVDAIFSYGHTGYTGSAARVYPEKGVFIVANTNRVHPDDSGKVADFRRMVWRTVGEILMGAGREAK